MGHAMAHPMGHAFEHGAPPRRDASCASLGGQPSGPGPGSSPRFNLEEARALALLHAR